MASKGLSRYQENFTRLAIASVDEIKLVFKDSLESQIKPKDLYSAINSCSKLTTGKQKLTLDQLKICNISPPQVPDYAKFDVSLLYKLIRNLCPKLKPTKGWGNTPDTRDLQIGDDIERLRRIRNEMFAHLESSEVSDGVFSTCWRELKGIIHRAHVFMTSLGYSVNYDKKLSITETSDFGREDMEKYKLLLEGMMILWKQSQSIDIPVITVNGNGKILCGEEACFEAQTEKCPDNNNWPITWEKVRGRVTEVIDTSKKKYKGSSSGRLVIREVVKEDEGEYRAVISRELDGRHFKISSNNLKLEATGDLPILEISRATSGINCVTIHYSCSVQNAFPEICLIQWTRNGEVLTMNADKYKGGGITDKYLEISSPTEDDSGKYICKVSNAVGSVQEFIVLGAPEVEIRRELTVTFGSRAIIKPLIKSCPPLEKAIWQKTRVSTSENFQEIDTADAKYFRSSVDPEKPILVIQKTSHADNLCYRLQVSNGIGTTSNVVSLQLEGDLPTVLTNHETDFFEKRVTLVCKISVSANSPGVTEVVWTKDKKQIDISGNGGKYVGGCISDPSLVINQVNSNDAGEYQCRVSNAVGDMYSSPIHLGLPHIEEHISCIDEEGENVQLSCKVTVKSIPEAQNAEWKVQQTSGDGGAINIHESTYRGSTVSLPHPVLIIHGYNPEQHCLIQFKATNFIGEKTKVIQSRGTKSKEEDDFVEKNGSHIMKYQNGTAAVLFANLRYDLAELFPQQKIENMKCLLCGLGILNQNTVKEILSMCDILNVLEREGYFSPEDVIWMQYCLRKIECRHLYEKCYQYAKQNEALCFYENQPEINGYRHVGFHIAGNIKDYSPKDICYIQKTVATMIGCSTEDVIVDGLTHHKSFVVVLSIKEEYIDVLLANAQRILDSLCKLNVDYIICGKAVIRKNVLDGEGSTESELKPCTSPSTVSKQVSAATFAATDARGTTSLFPDSENDQSHRKRTRKRAEAQEEKELKGTRTASSKDECRTDECPSYLFVAAIDLGTTRSGVAFSSRNSFTTEPTNVWMKTWQGDISTYKTPTAVLFDQNEEFASFGYEAEEKYTKLLEDDVAEGWNFFRRFKMSLYDQQTVLDSLELVADNGKKMPALKVFSASIKYLWEQLNNDIVKQFFYASENDVKWVITVPAIWSHPAKSFIRKAAIMAGLQSEKLTIALEPEAAAIFLKHLPLERKKLGEIGDNFRSFSPGSRYIIVDAGGGTIDITIHEVLDDGRVKELFQSSGGDWGGIKVNDRIMEFFEDVLGSHTTLALRQGHQMAMLELERNIERAKRSLTQKSKMTIIIPAIILELYKQNHEGADLSSVTSVTGRNGRIIQVSFSHDRLRLDQETSYSFFEESINSICSLLGNMLYQIAELEINTIIMVGGYANCSFLTSTILKEFPDKHVIVPNEAEWSVLKGAVIFGHDPGLIKQRRSRYTYGVKCKKLFIDGEHDPRKIVEENGRFFCQDLFSKHVEIGELITVGEYQTNKKYRISHEARSKIRLFASQNPDPKYVTEEGCCEVGKLEISGPGLEVGSKIRVQLSFSHTEIEARISHRKSGKSSALYLDINS